MVVYGCADRAVEPCSTAAPIVTGLEPANVNICDNISVACNPVIPAGTVKYFRVEIQNFTYRAGIWNLATKTGAANSTYYFALKPATTMRYIP
mgnify:CR=1 FL=1